MYKCEKNSVEKCRKSCTSKLKKFIHFKFNWFFLIGKMSTHSKMENYDVNLI